MNDPRSGFLPISEYLQQPREKETWLLKPLIPTGGACLLYGSPKLGKSYLAAQLAAAITDPDIDDWLGFPVGQHGKVLYLQLDTPRGIWAHRFNELVDKGVIKGDNKLFCLADRDSIDTYPFDILQPTHMIYLKQLIQSQMPAVAVIIDTLREANSGDENSSTSTRNVLVNLAGATHPAALIVISHDRKPHPDIDKDIMNDHRGSDQVVARMDAIMRLTKTRLFYAGRSIEAGDIKLQRLDSGFWQQQLDETGPIIEKVLADTSLTTLRAKARALATLIYKSEEAAMSILRRTLAAAEKPTPPDSTA